MFVLGYEICPVTIAKIGFAIIALGFLGIVAFLAALKYYVYVTCGVCKSKARMDGKTVIITGATSGIGKETARDLAKRGARVILACRNLEAANRARDQIVKETENEDIVVKQLDLSSQKSIREFADNINRNETKLNVLIHNAGTAETRAKTSTDGVELTMATNHFGPFLLTHLLIDLMKKSGPSRIIVVASELYRIASVNLNKVNPLNYFFPPYIYYVSKYANIYFTLELARRLQGTKVTANCLHPGMIDSGIWRNVPIPFSWGLALIIKGYFKSPEQGCQTTVYLAVAEELEGVNGKYFSDCRRRGLTTAAKNEGKAKKFWELSEQMANLTEEDPKV